MEKRARRSAAYTAALEEQQPYEQCGQHRFSFTTMRKLAKALDTRVGHLDLKDDDR